MADDQQLEAQPAGDGKYEPPTVTPIGAVAELTGPVDGAASVDDT